MADVEITGAEPDGSDRVDVRGFVDGVPVRAMVRRADVLAQPAGNRRRYVAGLLKAAAVETAKPRPFEGLLGQETGV